MKNTRQKNQERILTLNADKNIVYTIWIAPLSHLDTEYENTFLLFLFCAPCNQIKPFLDPLSLCVCEALLGSICFSFRNDNMIGRDSLGRESEFPSSFYSIQNSGAKFNTRVVSHKDTAFLILRISFEQPPNLILAPQATLFLIFRNQFCQASFAFW